MFPEYSDGEALNRLLEKIHSEKGWDFRGYKAASLKRRVSKRLIALNIKGFREYSEFLDSDQSEYGRLFSNLTIKVSEFFREPGVFGLLGKAAVEFFPPNEGLKVWCCGCAYGEEAYSLAITLSESLTPEGVSNTRVFATDIDAEAVDQARRAEYREDVLRNVGPEIRDKYFFSTEGLYKVKYRVRNLVKFGILDIIKSPSISKVEILSCRNLFIYFDKSLQERIFEKFDYSLKPGGLLVLGKAEVIPSAFASRYSALGGRMSVYRKTG